MRVPIVFDLQDDDSYDIMFITTFTLGTYAICASLQYHEIVRNGDRIAQKVLFYVGWL